MNLENHVLHTFRDFFDSQQTDSTQNGTEITTCQDWYMYFNRRMVAIFANIKCET